ncbi:hypothetical protein K443DRAFT_126162, partial [Laccaria amethystina LaAM-08-1]
MLEMLRVGQRFLNSVGQRLISGAIEKGVVYFQPQDVSKCESFRHMSEGYLAFKTVKVCNFTYDSPLTTSPAYYSDNLALHDCTDNGHIQFHNSTVAQGGSARPDIASLIYKHFENPEPFIYEKPVDIFAPLWETPSPVAIRTKDDAARKERLSQYGTAVFDDLWRHLLVHILRCFLLGMLPFDGLSNSARSIYQERYSDLNFRKLHRPVVESWPQGARGSETLVDVVKHWFTNQLYQE